MSRQKTAADEQELKAELGDHFIRDVTQQVRDASSGSAVRCFLKHVIDQASVNPDGCEAKIVAIWSGRRPLDLPPGEYTGLLVSVLKGWNADLETKGVFSATSRPAYVRWVARLLHDLGEADPARYAAFPPGIVSVRSGVGDVKTLGELQWPECQGAQGMERDKLALKLLKADALSAVEGYLALNRHARLILSTEDAQGEANQKDWMTMRHVFQQETGSWKTTGRSSFAGSADRSWLTEVSDLAGKVFDPALWIGAGFMPDQVACLEGAGLWGGIHIFVDVLFPCLGPTPRLIHALTQAFACSTGWNLQPMQSLPRHPFMYLAGQERGVCSSLFATSYKARAGHDVVARLETGGVVSPERLTALWKETQHDVDPAETGDGHAILRGGETGRDDRLVKALDDYSGMAERARCLDPHGVAADRFLFALSQKRGIVVDDDFPLGRWNKPDCLMGRKDAGYRSIRKTFLSVRYDDVRSVTALKEEAGHRSLCVLQRYYLTSDTVKSIHVDSLRMFQNSLQAHVLEGSGCASIDMVMEPGTRDWFKRLSVLSGVAAAIGVDQRAVEDGSPRATVRFYPTDENLRALYLTHLSLIRCRRSVGALRWAVQGVPLLAAVKAIGSKLAEQGLMPSYVRNARVARRALAAGDVVVPPTLEV